MEDALEVYSRPRETQRPLVCLDEFCKPLSGDTRAPVAARPGQPARTDHEYERRGMCSALMVYSRWSSGAACASSGAACA